VYSSLFKRKNLASYTYTDKDKKEIIIGNLQDIVHTIEEIVENRQVTAAKEEYPFICVVNPPRHGKSLLLDRLFWNRKDICVVEMTYNCITNLTKEEFNGTSSEALYYFWLRFIHTVITSSLSLVEVSNLVGSFDSSMEYDLVWAKDRLKVVFNMTPFEDDMGETKPLLIAVDEFSKLIDVAEKWNKNERNLFVRSLQNNKRAKPFVQFVFTGFNRGITNLMEASSAPVQVLSLSLCDFSSARPLLDVIKHEYDKNFNNKIAFPTLLYEVVKSTPGLVGLWAERLFHLRCRDSSLYEFAELLPWTKEIKSEENLETNWNLLVRFFICIEMKNKYAVQLYHKKVLEVGELMITNLIGVMSNGQGTSTVPLISPFCMVIIVEKYKVQGNNNLMKQLHTHLSAAIDACDADNTINKNGKFFENFVTAALKVRILLRMIHKQEQQIQHPEQQIDHTFSFCDLFPVRNDDSTYVLEIQDVDRKPFPCYIHGISNKFSLMDLLTAPLYYIFPIGTNALNIQTIQSTSSGHKMSSWLKLNYKVLEKSIDFDVELPSSSANEAINCGSKINFVCKTHPAFKLDSEDEKQVSSPIEPEKTVKEGKLNAIWNNIQTTIDKILHEHENGIFMFQMAESAAGCDLVMLLREINKDDAEAKIMHIVAIEIKDRRGTEETKWKDKISLLTSHRCIIRRLRAALLLGKGFSNVRYHIVLAGREHGVIESYDSSS